LPSCGVCPSIRPSHAGIVSKQLNLYLNFFDHLAAPSFQLLTLSADTQFHWEPRQRGAKYMYRGWGKLAIF